ncbi:826_t:CDS:1 [Paraglomus brasilianum]|uniref:826_t:CDS:1 n=1 Tax=Paraglomus brasilianum TaxID=144538 RepID=A0A9N9G7A7_9GLOM|nr:826_t:CDS:1 [Paraglomus brasilianum]
MNKENKTITSLYDKYKNTPKKLKIICDWDEVIQAHEPHALWLTHASEDEKLTYNDFRDYFKMFWENDVMIEYSPYGSKMSSKASDPRVKNVDLEQQQEIKNSPNFYHQAPFLTIAEDLLKLIKEDKIEKLIFLSAYDKRKFHGGDMRKENIFRETFGKLAHFNKPPFMGLTLIPFDSETQGRTKAE